MGFNSLINQFLVSFQDVNNEVLFENLFRWFKIYLNELDLKFLLEINQDSINYLENYLNTGLMSHSGYFKGFDNFKNNDSVLESNLTINNISWAPVFNVDKVSLNENIISNMILVYQNYIQLLLEKNLFSKAKIYLNKYLENYDYRKFKHKSLELIFKTHILNS